mmetsp:Transcript_161/g.256  ORF Transcript_161/g.256 Transcript_161/m.256 type:complete len:756 (+) Transcript_161:200-2467(+)
MLPRRALSAGSKVPHPLGVRAGGASSNLQKRGFRIDKSVIERYQAVKPPFGFNGLGELVYYRTYARLKTNGKRERWHETVQRVVNGTFSMQERWIKDNILAWDEDLAQERAAEMYDRIFRMKMLPPGRGLWCMGTSVTEERGLFAALNNCAFVSTDDADVNFADPFCFTMDASMLGVGVGFDTAGAGKVLISKPVEGDPHLFVVPDSREGWVNSLRCLLESYITPGQAEIVFDYSRVRPAGTPIRGFGGTSSGPEPLIKLHEAVKGVLDKNAGEKLTVTSIVDIMNMVGRCVVAGNVRRTAEIAFGDAESLEYIELKNYNVNPHRADYGWTSNNSVFARLGMDYSDIVERVKVNGEPGFAWLENMRNFGRMNGKPDYRDFRAAGGNPCLEQTLESHELCCLVETFPNHHDDLEDYKRTLASAFLYAKTVTLGKTHWPKSNRVMLRNRRIGTSMSGIAQFVADRGLHSLQEWCEAGYDEVQKCDEEYSEWLAIPKSIKTTSIKPSGTVSLLAGATPGMHAPESRFYIRRVRVGKDSEVLEPLRKANYHLEPDVADPDNTVVVSIPIDAGQGVRTSSEINLWEQLSLAAFLQRHWADNQVSCTVTFDPESEGSNISQALDVFQYQLKGVSFLPRLPVGAYAQMPYEEISEEQFKSMSHELGELDLSVLCGPLLENEEHESGSIYDTSVTTSSNINHRDSLVSKETETNTTADSFGSLSIDDGVGLAGSGEMMPDSFCDADGCVLPPASDQPVKPILK